MSCYRITLTPLKTESNLQPRVGIAYSIVEYFSARKSLNCNPPFGPFFLQSVVKTTRHHRPLRLTMIAQLLCSSSSPPPSSWHFQPHCSNRCLGSLHEFGIAQLTDLNVLILFISLDLNTNLFLVQDGVVAPILNTPILSSMIPPIQPLIKDLKFRFNATGMVRTLKN